MLGNPRPLMPDAGCAGGLRVEMQVSRRSSQRGTASSSTSRRISGKQINICHVARERDCTTSTAMDLSGRFKGKAALHSQLDLGC
jgi:hypothetical protein